ncbi:MAG TPA: hypothetical protein VI818_00130, partial [Candidatus Thermoplasmatota archaeon]|nr:hypothetical protein [Candidatus Thermoplasmatota archaeon]
AKVLCAGCVGVVAGAIVGALVLKALGPLASWSQEWLIVGAALAVVGSAPALIGDRGPWTRTVSRIPLGAGIAAYAMGLASLPLGGASAAFAVAGAATLVLGWLRARAMANRSARHAHTTACGAA